jgi:sulfoxide reductase heme-binding subunit YedZ
MRRSGFRAPRRSTTTESCRDWGFGIRGELESQTTTNPESRFPNPARLAGPVIVALSVLPALYLAWTGYQGLVGFSDALGANPIKELEHATGRWAIRFLALSLAVTPLRKLSGWGELATYRRPLGLFAFFYATLHLAVFVALDLELDFGEVTREVVKRPYITVGFTAWLLLVPLALTSTAGAIRRLGKRWSSLHSATYAVAALGLLHYWWSQKKDRSGPLAWGLVFAVLLAWRVAQRVRRRRPSPARSAAGSGPTPLSPAAPRTAPHSAPDARRSARG